jgi:hypothetical protein
MAADELVRGMGWNGKKGCAVGCTLEAYDHSRYPIELGLPEWVAHLEDKIFEGLPLKESKTWPLRFLESIPVGADIDAIKTEVTAARMNRLIKIQQAQLQLGKHDKKTNDAILLVIDAIKMVLSAASSASSAAWAEAQSAAASSASSAAWAEAQSAAESAAESAAAEVEELAAESAESAAESAESAAAEVEAESAEAEDLLRIMALA